MLQVAINIVFNDGNTSLESQLQQRHTIFFRHSTAQRIVEVGDRGDGGDLVPAQGAFGFFDTQPFARRGWDSHNFEPNLIENVQKTIVGGGLGKDRIPRLRHRAQSEVKSFRSSVDDDEFVVAEVAAQSRDRRLISRRSVSEPGTGS